MVDPMQETTPNHAAAHTKRPSHERSGDRPQTRRRARRHDEAAIESEVLRLMRTGWPAHTRMAPGPTPDS